MASLNSCSFIGRVGRDPEVKQTASGQSVANFSIACGEKFKNKAGEYEERTEWINLVAWGKTAEIVEKYVEKGKEIYVNGRMQTRKYQDKEGNDKYATDIVIDKLVLLGGKSDGSKASSSAGGSDVPPAFGDDEDSQIPF